MNSGVWAIVVRRWGRWLLSRRPGESPGDIALDDIVASLGSPRPKIHSDTTISLDPDEFVAPLWAWAGVLRSDGVHTEDAVGEALVLDAADLRVLDALREPCSVATLQRTTGADADQLTRLVTAGKIRRVAFEPALRPPEERFGNVPDLMLAGADPRHPDDPPRPGRIPVYALMHAEHGVPLGLGMVTAAARAHEGGRLTEHFEIRRPEPLTSILSDLDHRSGPAVLLVSDVIWTLEANLRAAAQIVERTPEVVVIHGGPSAPRFDAEIQRFFADHDEVAHVLVRGEGERTIGELLGALGAAGGRLADADLTGVAGIAFRATGSGAVVRTPDRPRETRLDDLPSPYLTGEFDHITVSGHDKPVALETNRGCPYECTFCDWGSATNSRIRFFSPERVAAEIDWLATRGAHAIFIADANFGITKRDIETSLRLAEARARTGAFGRVYWTAAKNTTKHLVEIWRAFGSAGIVPEIQIALQTTDPQTLKAIRRSNISTEHLLDLARIIRQEAMPVRAELMIGLPGQTVDSFLADLALLFDQEMALLSWMTLVLPNAPMNEPTYRARWGIRLDEHGVVTETSTAGALDRQRMLRLRRLFLAADTYGVLRHVVRWLQQDCGVAATAFMADVCSIVEREPERYPAMTWLVDCFDLHPLPPQGWTTFYEDVRDYLVEQYRIDPSDSALNCVLAVQRSLMPWPGRQFPDEVVLDHDYVSYYLDSVAPLYADVPRRDVAPLSSRPPGALEVRGDPAALGSQGMNLFGNPRDDASSSAYTLVFNAAHELDSPLVRLLPEVLRRFEPGRAEQITAQRRTWAETVAGETLAKLGQIPSIDGWGHGGGSIVG